MTDVGIGAPATAAAIAAPRGHGTLRRLLRHRSFLIGFTIIALLAILALLAPLIAPVDPSAMRVRFRFRPPQAAFWFGTDQFGRDIFTRVLYGTRISLFVGFAVCVVSGLCSAILGVIAAQFRRLDSAIMRLMDALMSFPAILLALGIAAALGPRVSSVIIALTVAYIPAGVRIVRAAALTVREMDYVQAAQVSGASSLRIVLRHILPNCFSPLLVHLTFIFAYAMLAEAALSFLGVGIQPPIASWGNIIAEGRDYATQAWWVMLFPGIAISLAALSLNLLGDALGDMLDPRLKGGE
ncbi:ABC transporter permease [Bradyrhizobium rifense]|uniref:ABC transporter permease n=1 Tax=Bradyrhizobium rifense TaxID=515499 RepID=A0A5D3KDA5_9BRAD|nr:ABC transporter permease [Bradyrhizobium rifense]TYL94351.1 ABC transporter permease [Bradyrhizobium rifense]